MEKEKGSEYVHGYSKRETKRLYDQAGSVKQLIHQDTIYPWGSKVLEAGCGVGAQTLTLAQNSPQARFFSVDWAEYSLELARDLVSQTTSKRGGNQALLYAIERKAIENVYS